MSRYVQHKSGQGEKWLVREEGANTWHVEGGPAYDGRIYTLPKPEYIKCDQPEVWVDVTGACEVDYFGHRFNTSLHRGLNGYMYIVHGKGDTGKNICTDKDNGYRLRKVLLVDGSQEAKPAFIVEKRS